MLAEFVLISFNMPDARKTLNRICLNLYGLKIMILTTVMFMLIGLRDVWGNNSSPFVALLANKCLVNKNPTNASQLALNAMTIYRYMDDMLTVCNSLCDLQTIALEEVDLFGKVVVLS